MSYNSNLNARHYEVTISFVKNTTLDFSCYAR